jgi:hypothetical protein
MASRSSSSWVLSALLGFGLCTMTVSQSFGGRAVAQIVGGIVPPSPPPSWEREVLVGVAGGVLSAVVIGLVQWLVARFRHHRQQAENRRLQAEIDKLRVMVEALQERQGRK